MVVGQELIDWIKNELAKGYSIEEITTTLIQQGYTPEQAKEGIAAASFHPKLNEKIELTPRKPRKTIETSTLLLALIIFILISGIVAGGYFFFFQEQIRIMQEQESEFDQGENQLPENIFENESNEAILNQETNQTPIGNTT
jgi:hypothetical protein